MHRGPVHDVPVIKSIRKSYRRSRWAKLFSLKIDRHGRRVSAKAYFFFFLAVFFAAFFAFFAFLAMLPSIKCEK
jgi:hypothetical protein